MNLFLRDSNASRREISGSFGNRSVLVKKRFKASLLLFTLLSSFGAFSQTQTQTFNNPANNGQPANTFTVPSGVTSITVEVWGAGGGGGNSNNTTNNGGAGGGGGGYARKALIGLTPGTTYTVTVGAGGIGAPDNSTTNATNGGDSQFEGSGITTITGGGGRLGDASGENTNGTGGNNTGGNGGTATGGDVNYSGGNGGNSGSSSGGGGGSSASTSSDGDNGDAGDGNNNDNAGGNVGGDTTDGPGGTGEGSNNNQPGGNGTIPGGGGGGSNDNDNSAGGNGANGQVIVTYNLPPQTFYSRQSGNWHTLSTWSLTSHTVDNAPSFLPRPEDIVLIGGNDNVTIQSNSASITISSLTVDDGSTGTLTYGDNNNTNTPLTVTGDFIIGANGTVQVGGNGDATHTMSIGGNLVNANVFNMINVVAGTDDFVNVTFNGTATRTISGSGDYTFNNFTLNAGGNDINIQSNIDIEGDLTFSANGLLIVDSNSNISLSGGSAINGANGNRYIQLDGIDGANSNLIKVSDGTTGSWQFTFPIGTTTGGYTPLTIPTIATAPDGNSTLAVKIIITGDVSGKSKRSFQLTVTGNNNGTTFSNAAFSYNDGTDISSGDSETNYTTAWRTESGSSSAVASTVNTGANTFTVTGGTAATATLNDGTYLYYLGAPLPPRSWYSYQNGNYNDYNTWTLDPSGTTFDNGLNLFPTNGDQIHILNGFTVSVNVNNQTLVSTEIQGGGTLDMGTSTNNNLGIITGTGLLRVRDGGTAFPTGTYTDFVSTTGGTIEYYNAGGTLSTVQTTYNNLRLTNSTGSITYTLVSDMLTNGNFDVNTIGTGTVTWQINDGSGNQRSITLNGDLNVGANGRITVGTGNEASTTQHSLTMYGNIINNGIVKFYDPTDTELDEAYYGMSYPVTGGNPDLHRNELQGNAVTVTFAGTNNRTVTCNNTTDFYRFVVNKGTGQQAVLTVSSSNTAYFRLFGPSDLATTESGNSWEYISRNALSIVNGTLELTGSINIPNLQIDVSGTGYFPIPRNGALWLNGPDVTVQISDNNPTGGDKDGRILMSGLLRVTNGTLRDGFSKGLGSQDGGTYFQEGGTVNCWQFRPRATGTGIFSFIQTGGTLNVGYGYALSGGKIDQYEEDYCRFDLNSPNSTFQMSGTAVLNVAKPTNNNNNNGGLFLIASSSANYNVTGGTVNLYTGQERTGAIAYPGYINTTVPLYNVNIYEESATTQVAQLQTNSLTVLNHLTINTGNTPSFVTDNLNVTIGGNFIINASTTYDPGTGTTTFNGAGAQAWTNSGTISALNTVVVNKPSGILTLSGNNFPNTGSITNLTLTSGTLNDGAKTVVVAGTLTNNAIHTSTGVGSITYSGTNAIGGNNGTFGNLYITTPGTTTVNTSGNQTITGTLRLVNNVTLNIGNYALTVLGNIYSDAAGTAVAFAANKRIQTSGFHNAGGLTRQGTGDILFPLGTGTLYTPNTINVTASTHGTITVRPVASAHPNVFITGRSVQYYWRVTSSGYSGITSVTHSAYNYSTATEGAPPSGAYRTARFDATALTWGYTNPGSYAVGTTPPIPTFNTNTGWFNVTGSQLNGEYTCGDVSAFGAVTPYYSKGNGAWNAATGVWTSSPTHAGADLAGPPCPTCPVVIGDGAGINHTITVTTVNASCGTLALNAGSTLDCGTQTGLNFGTSTSGTGTLRVATVTAGAGVFPRGDFNNFVSPTGGTVEWYGATKTIPGTYIGANGTTQNLTTYYNLLVNPNNANTITLPAASITIYNNMTQGSAAAYSGTVLTNGSQSINVDKDLTISRGIFSFSNANPSVTTLIVGGNSIIANGATMQGQGGGTANTNTFSTPGNITNNGTINFRNTQLVNIIFTGTNNATCDGNGATTLNLVTVNKGTSQTPTVTFGLSGTLSTTAAAGGWLTLNNGTFDYEYTGSSTVYPAGGATIGALSTSSYTIPTTAKLKVGAGTVAITSGNGGNNDLFLNGTLEVSGGTVYTRTTAASGSDNDIEYSSAGNPSIIVSGGSLTVDGSIRRSTSVITGALVYNQSGGTVTVGGNNANNTRGVFEIDHNAGSSFTLTGSATLNVQRQTGGSGYADVYINPISSNVSATSTITVGISTATTQNNLRVYIEPAIGNFSIQNGNGSNAQTTILYNDLTLGGTLTIPNPSVLNATVPDPDANVTIAGNFNCTGFYNAGTNTTTFNGTGPQAATLSTNTDFYDVTLSKTAGTTLTLSGTAPTAPALNNLNILSGILDVSTIALTVERNITNNSSQVGSGSIVVYSDDAGISNTITSSGGSFTNLTLGGTLANRTVSVSGNLTINGALNFTGTTRYLDIASGQLTFGLSASVVNAGSTRFVRTNGVASDLGVIKNWPTGTNTFTYPIGTSTNYTPVSYSLNVSTAGALTVIPVNSAHLTYNQSSSERILNYYWTVKRDASLVATASGNHTYSYPSSLITGTGGTLVAGYLDPNSNPLGWTTSGHGGTATTTQMTFANTPTSNFPAAGSYYDYSVGTANTLPNPILPLYSRLSTANVANPALGGDWTTNASWTTQADGMGSAYTSAFSGPRGIPLVILPGARINVNQAGRVSYRMTINGLLYVGTSAGAATTGHNLGRIEGTGTLRVLSNTFPAGDYTSFVSSAGGTIEYAYTGTLSMNNRVEYNNLTFLSGTALATNNDVTVNGNLTISSGATLNNSFNRTISVARNWTNNGTFTTTSGIIAFNGSTAQSISGATTFNNLTVSKPSNNLTLNSAVAVNNILALTSGHLITTSANLLSLPTAATINGGSSSSFISGPMQKVLASGTFIAPLGNVAMVLYRPLSINTASATTWRFEYVPRNPPGSGIYPHLTVNPAAEIKSVSKFEYWVIDRISGSSSADVTLSYDAGSYAPPNIGTLANLRVARWDGTQWDIPPGGGTHTQAGSNVTGTLSVTGVTDFSPFTLASLDVVSPLPVVWLSFTAQRVNNDVLLEWQTAQEINNDHFEVERSEDGRHFYKVGEVMGSGNSPVPMAYSFQDKKVAYHQRHYYRLRQVDFDGRYDYSSIVSIQATAESGDGNKWTVYPNPSSGQPFEINYTGFNAENEYINIVIVSSVGQVMGEANGFVSEVNKTLAILTESIPAGAYVLKVTDGIRSEMFRIVRY